MEQTAALPQESAVDLGTVVTRVRALSRLETASMHVVNVSTITQSYEFVPNAIGGDELTLFAAGDVIAGIDLSQIKQSDVWREPDGTLDIRLPPPQILVSRIDNRESHVINRRTGFLRRADLGLEGRARQYAEQQIRNEAFHRGILQMASDNAESKLAPLLHELGFTKAKFVRPVAPSVSEEPHAKGIPASARGMTRRGVCDRERSEAGRGARMPPPRAAHPSGPLAHARGDSSAVIVRACEEIARVETQVSFRGGCHPGCHRTVSS